MAAGLLVHIAGHFSSMTHTSRSRCINFAKRRLRLTYYAVCDAPSRAIQGSTRMAMLEIARVGGISLACINLSCIAAVAPRYQHWAISRPSWLGGRRSMLLQQKIGGWTCRHGHTQVWNVVPHTLRWARTCLRGVRYMATV